jgi:hypothetical protein
MLSSAVQFGKWHGRPAREITRKMRVPQFALLKQQHVYPMRVHHFFTR